MRPVMRRGDALTTLRDGVELQQRELRLAFAELATAARSSVDSKRLIENNPFACVLGALALGFWLGRRPHGAR